MEPPWILCFCFLAAYEGFYPILPEWFDIAREHRIYWGSIVGALLRRRCRSGVVGALLGWRYGAARPLAAAAPHLFRAHAKRAELSQAILAREYRFMINPDNN